ncbi:MAG: RNA polymerase sporulation sigma factor SigE [Clostridia bacterium]|nr:RNA polymerase sporulation sigma factor SigE [Clostridia bacterium]
MFKFLKKLILKIFGGEEKFVNYLSGAEALPQPFTPAEEQELLTRLQDDEDGVRSSLIEHNLRLVVYIARKFDNTGVELEDLVSVGTIGLIKAVKTFNTDKNIKLATYASRCIENEILMHLRRVVKLKGEVSLDEPLNVDYEGNELLLSDVLGTDSDVVYKDIEASAERQMLREAIAKLSPRERQIMNLRFGLSGGDELTQKQVADLLGISQSYISRLEKKIVARLRKEFLKLSKTAE